MFLRQGHWFWAYNQTWWLTATRPLESSYFFSISECQTWFTDLIYLIFYIKYTWYRSFCIMFLVYVSCFVKYVLVRLSHSHFLSFSSPFSPSYSMWLPACLPTCLDWLYLGLFTLPTLLLVLIVFFCTLHCVMLHPFWICSPVLTANPDLSLFLLLHQAFFSLFLKKISILNQFCLLGLQLGPKPLLSLAQMWQGQRSAAQVLSLWYTNES